jgi:hypothetical protein
MASTRWISALCAGSSKDTNLKKDRMAVRRRLRLRAGAELYLEIGEERADERCIQIGERQGRWGLPQPHLCEHEQQPERVPVGGDRVGANIALAHEALGEEALDQRGDIAGGLHGVTSHRRSRVSGASFHACLAATVGS